MLTYRTTLLLTQLKIDLLYSASRHDWKKMINLPCKSNLVLLIDTAVGVVGVELLNSLVGVSCWDERNSQVYSKRTRHKKSERIKETYLIKKIDCDIIKKGHISSSVLLSVHWLLGWFQQTAEPNTFVHVRFCDYNHPPGAFVLLLILLLLIGVAPRRKTSSSSNPVSDGPVSKSSFSSSGEGKTQSKRWEGEREAS